MITGILLAAGTGRRYGADKRLHPLADGTPMVLASARHLQAACPDALAVVADDSDEAAQLLARAGLRLVINPAAATGMGGSIASGVAASADADGWIIALADMPFVPETVIARLVAGLEQGADLIAPVCDGRRGHPVGFSRRHGASLQALEGDRGARDLLAAHADTLEQVPVTERGVIVDLDQAAAPEAGGVVVS